MNKRSTGKNIIALFFLTFFLVVSIFSGVFLFTHANHEHDHNGMDGDCTICIQLQNAENILEQFGMALSGISVLSLIGLYTLIRLTKAISLHCAVSTPITLKNQMNN